MSTQAPAGTTAGGARGLAGRLALDPLAPFLAVVPMAVVVTALRTPVPATGALLVFAAACVLVRPAPGARVAVGALLLSAVVTTALALSAPLERVGSSPTVLSLGPVSLQQAQLGAGATLGTKVGALLSMFVLTGLLARPQSLLQAMVAHLRVPYRVAYAGVAALGLTDRFRQEYRTVREAHALRGTRADATPLGPVVRWCTAVPALTAGTVRHAERMSMSMDARGFGAYPTRSERHPPQWRARDTATVLLLWGAAAAVLLAFHGSGYSLHGL